MAFDLIPRAFFNIPSRLPSIFEEDDNWATFLPSSGLSVSEDEKQVFIEAAMPGLESKNIEVSVDKGVLWIRGNQEETEEDKKRKFYRKASAAFSYRVVVPGNIDESKEPQAVYKNGVMKIIFQKTPIAEPKKITIQSE